MQMRSAKELLGPLCVCVLVGCTSTAAEPAAAAPHHEKARPAAQMDGEQRALEKRLQQLESQALSELRQLRESRQASTGAAEPARDDANAPPSDEELLILGGAKHEVFLGCLCDEHRSDSVFNMLGEHGSHSSPASIRNKFALYGSNYDDTSACNVKASHPPVVVAADGKSLGLLTLNASLARRITAPSVTNWLARMCGE
jgi:hypothetical protein